MATDNTALPAYLQEASRLAKFPFSLYSPDQKLRVCVTGAGGFIGSHLAKRLKAEGHSVIACDWKRNDHMEASRMFFSSGLESFFASFPAPPRAPPLHGKRRPRAPDWRTRTRVRRHSTLVPRARIGRGVIGVAAGGDSVCSSPPHPLSPPPPPMPGACRCPEMLLLTFPPLAPFQKPPKQHPNRSPSSATSSTWSTCA
jgi:hypothetical protein